MTEFKISSKYKLPGLTITDRMFELPLNYEKPKKGSIEVFAREVVSNDNAARDNLPWLVFFQGGPGYQSPRPTAKSGWLRRALRDSRVLLLDQRGTGMSTPINYRTLERFDTAEEQADYLKNFRADSIVKDAELIRQTLAGEKVKWFGLGQSYGGFCLTHYLSAAPEGLRGVIMTGGIPPVGVPIDDVYRATYKTALSKNEQYYKRYPDDIKHVRDIVSFLKNNLVLLPGGGRLTAERFQQLGFSFGMSDGFESVHYLIEEAFAGYPNHEELCFSFLKKFEFHQSFETNPIYALLHESIYCEKSASRWSAHRIRDEFPQFSSDRNGDQPILFTGEMIYPWMFDQYDYLSPLKETAELLAQYDGWGTLYDTSKLKKNRVPTVAVVYYEDMYVERAYSEATASGIGSTRLWITNEYEHNGLRADGYRILDRLINMLTNEI